MIICSNCGTINSEEEGRFCRTCGALLPLPTKYSKVKANSINDSIAIQNLPEKKNGKVSTEKSTKKNKKKKSELPQLNSESQFFTGLKKKQDDDLPFTLEEIPKPDVDFQEEHVDMSDVNNNNEISIPDLSNIPNESETNEDEKKEFLKEITPPPFNGSILSKSVIGRSNKVTPPNIPKVKYFKSPIREKEVLNNQSIPEETNSLEVEEKKTVEKSPKITQLEKEMSDVLTILSKKIRESPKKEPLEKVSTISKSSDEKTQPSSLNDILTHLLRLDQYIEASAIIKEDGTILASTLSNRISDALFATIGQNLSMIGSDIMEGLSAGKLTSISIKGTEGILDLAPIDKKNTQLKDMILMVFSHPRVKSGIIVFATNIVKKQIKEYLGIGKSQ